MGLPDSAGCRACVTGRRAGAPWCTLCFTDLRGRPDPRAAPAPLPGPPAPRAGDCAWPCGACGGANDYSRSTCSGCGSAFLAVVRDTAPPLLRLPLVGDLLARSRAYRLLLAFGLVLALVLPLAVATVLLTPHAAQHSAGAR